MLAYPDDPDDRVDFVLSAAELVLLKRFGFPGTRRVIKTARPVLEGFALFGTAADVKHLLRHVSAEVDRAIVSGYPNDLLSTIALEIGTSLILYR